MTGVTTLKSVARVSCVYENGLSQLQLQREPNYYVTFIKTGNRMIVSEAELKKVEE